MDFLEKMTGTAYGGQVKVSKINTLFFYHQWALHHLSQNSTNILTQQAYKKYN